MQDLNAAEQSIIGALLLTNGKILDELDFNPRDYHQPIHEVVHRTIAEMKAANQPIDALTVMDALARAKEPIPATFLHEAMQATPSAASATHYAGIVTDAATLRRVQSAATSVHQMVHDGGDADVIVEEARKLMDGTQPRSRNQRVSFLEDTMEATINYLDEEVDSVPTIWPSLNDIITGLRPGAVYVVGARPSVGKSVVAMQMAQALLKVGSVAFVSLEMSVNDLTSRLISNELKIDMGRIVRHDLTPTDWKRISEWMPKRQHVPLAINDNSGSTIADIRAFARNVNRRKPLAGVVVDYMQLMSAPIGDRRPRHEFVSEMSRQLKILAMDLHVPVIALSQLNRSSESREDKRPGLSDLRESGSIEQDADVVILLHREIMGDKKNDISFAVAKNRHGATGMAHMQFAGHYSEVRDA
ncbi:replicative DNA helicase [Arthrobacter roseus]|uniref:replicative DNA helicase n=1 Tax=Arthrobacter roseus TaxID=136274 RepID=UPI0019639E4A|nr:replicative DNA helicase [Arthrobacter roseus]MBM7847482.1 replicative DNA helicase [Arthrobacter roseus]